MSPIKKPLFKIYCLINKNPFLTNIYYRVLKRFYFKAINFSSWTPPISNIKKLITIGATEYGDWTIPDNFLTSNSICYMAGAGDDISFDVGVVEKYGCPVYVFDPTPKAKEHFDSLITATKNNQKFRVHGYKNTFYELSPKNIDKIHFEEIGLWDKKDNLKFFNSNSIVNLQKTKDYILIKTDRLSQIMKKKGHKHLDLLKIDIEGAEYKVIDSIIEDKLKIKILCVEYDEAYVPLDKGYKGRIKQSILKLINYGYRVIDADKKHNYTFLLEEEYQKLKS